MGDVVKGFKDRLATIEEGLETDFLDFEQPLLDLENEVYDAIDFMVSPSEKSALQKIAKRIQQIKKEYNFYDEETERYYMFPDGEDED